MKIVGMRKEFYIGEVTVGHNCGFEDEFAELNKYHLFGVLENGNKIQITLYEEYGTCYSGWTTASWGVMKVKYANEGFGIITHVPKEDIVIPDIKPNFNCNVDDIENEVFTYLRDGGDWYYPDGFIRVNEELFNPTIRAKDKRLVWIFKGASGVGKSYLASKLEEVKVYETDSDSTLPDNIIADVVVLGNKYKHTVEKIKEKLFGDVEIHIVEFNL